MLSETVGRAPEEHTGASHPDSLADRAGLSTAALSANTERALRSDLALFTTWCAEQRVTTLPASPETVAAFVTTMARTRAPATVRRYVASIAAAQRAACSEESTGSEPVRQALRRMHRRKGRRQVQAKGLTRALLERLLDATGAGLIDARNRALLAVAYDTLLRRGELVALQVTDIVVERDGAATVLLRRSKTDPEGCGAQAYLAPDTVARVREWLDRSGVGEGRLFRSLRCGALGAGLGAGEVARIFKRMARQAELPEEAVESISGHSTRVGAAQDMVAEGIGIAAIQHAGRWKTSAMVNRYGERLLARRSGAAQLARLQHRA